MKVLDIRTRMLLAAVLPVVLASAMLAAVFLLSRFDDLQTSYEQRTRAVARQLALASEYGLFSANLTQLQGIVLGGLREPDVRWVAVLDAQGQLLVSAGDSVGSVELGFSTAESQGFDAVRRLDMLAQPVFASGIKLDDLYEDAKIRSSGAPAQLGQILVRFSRQSLDKRKHDMLLLGALVSFLGLLFGVALAAYLSRGVLRPVMRVTRLIERIGQGDFAAAAESNPGNLAADPLQDLQKNLRQMATRLASARDDLEQQIASATQELRVKKDEAEQANLAKSRFLAAASHDLRQPTHALGMFVTRLAQLPHDAQTGQLIGNLEASVQAMQNLLDGLLDISRLEAGAVHVNKKPFELGLLVAQLQHDLGQSAADKGLRLRIRPSKLWVLSDATLLYRILLNLVGNALRYTERGGVLVAARPVSGGTQVQLQVWDSGIGIAPEHQQAVFMEFYQVANSARDRTKGLGLGLNIVQRTSALLGHPLQLLSRPGIGTRFVLTLPCVAANLELATPTPLETTLPDDLKGVSVLVIEDDALVRIALVGLLQAWGLQVAQAQGRLSAEQFVADGWVPELIVSDYRLQGDQTGIALVQLLRAQLGQPVPACLISGDTDPGLMHAAQAAGLTLLHKPVRPAKLRNLLRRLVAAQRAESAAGAAGVDLA